MMWLINLDHQKEKLDGERLPSDAASERRMLAHHRELFVYGAARGYALLVAASIT